MILLLIISFIYKQYNYLDNNFIAIPQQFSFSNDSVNIDSFENEILKYSEHLPDSYCILDYCKTDINQDSIIDIVLLIKRPWQDWYFMRWHNLESPLINNKDSENFSSSIIILNYYESNDEFKVIWAGSAFISPLLKIASCNIGNDLSSVIITIEGIFENNFNFPGHYLSIWEWNGFGFSLIKRSVNGNFYDLKVYDINNDNIDEIFVLTEE